MQILDHGIQIKALKFPSIVELVVHGIGREGMPAQDLQV
jgi:hypothetical protein